MMTKLNMGQDCLDNQSPSKPRSATSPVAMFNHLHSLTSPNNSKCPVCINSSRLILTGSDAFNQDNHSQQKSGKQVKNGKGNGHDDDDDDREELTRAPDGGFGWFVVIASFICNVIVDGVIFSFGILMREISRDLGQSKGVTASVGSLLTGFYLLVGKDVVLFSS